MQIRKILKISVASSGWICDKAATADTGNDEHSKIPNLLRLRAHKCFARRGITRSRSRLGEFEVSMAHAMTERLAAIQAMHSAYVEATGIQLRCGVGEYGRERHWSDLINLGYTAEDVRFLMAHLKRQIALGKRFHGCLRFSSLVADPERFEEELAMARASARKPVQAPTEKALRTLRPVAVEPAPDATRPVSEGCKKALELIKEMRRSI